MDDAFKRSEYYIAGGAQPEEDEGPKRPQFSLPSIAEAIWKQKWAIATVWAVVSCIGIFVVRILPPVYQAEALVLLESQRIPHDFVSPTTVRADLWERLNSLEQRVLSHTQLVSLIETFGLYPEELKTFSQEVVIERMRANDIRIELEAGLGKSSRPPAFRVAYSGANPEQVAQVANRLAYLFIEQDLRERSVEAEGTAEFLESQLETARLQLETQEAKLGRYKTEHNGELPEQEGALLGTLSRLQVQLQSNQEAVRQSQQDKFFTRNALEQAIASADDLRTLIQRPKSTLGSTGSEALVIPQDPTEQAARELRRQLMELKQRYTPNHPEVLKVTEALRGLERAEREAPVKSAPLAVAEKTPEPSSDSSAARNPDLAYLLEPELRRRQEQIVQLQNQLKSLEIRIDTLQSTQQDLAQSIAVAEQQVHKLPIREQEIAALVRDYEITKANYQSLLRKRMDANLAMEMEKRQKSEKFVLLDAARVPTEPVKPKVWLLSWLSSGVGLLLGAIVGVAKELRKDVFLGEWELPNELGVLGRVPHFAVGVTQKTPLDFRRVIAASSILLLLLILAIGAVALQSGWPSI